MPLPCERGAVTLLQLRRFAIARSLFAPTTLKRAIDRLGFVQADPIRAPARAQDLTLRHRVKGYRAGDLERRYPALGIEEDFFVNYGFLPRPVHALMHPRRARLAWSPARRRQAEAVHAYVREHGVVHPRRVDAHFAPGRVIGGFGGASSATTRLLDDMHYRGMLRVARREAGIRLYEMREAHEPAVDATIALDRLIDVIVAKYAPLPGASLVQLVRYLAGGTPQWRGRLKQGVERARTRLCSAASEGVDWYWPAGEVVPQCEPEERVRLLAPFDPVVWDRRRFGIFWGWTYRFEAYTPAAKRRLGYYALPLLWCDEIVGWGNLSVVDEELHANFGYVSGKAPRGPAFRRALDEELQNMRAFLGLDLT
ncbi:MAG: DNA glycosylase AlkZ-like family protein [Burkholderiales bacterium]